MKKIFFISLIIFCSAIFLFFYFSFRTVEIRDINKTYNEDNYLKTASTSSFKSHFISFPRYLDNIDTINDYYYIDEQIHGNSIVVLDASYDEVGFKNEIERLDNLMVRNWMYEENNDYGQYKKLLFCDDGILFDMPTYVAEYFNQMKYEYVCIDFENMRCVYVFFEGYNSSDKIPLNNKYQPKNINTNKYYDDNDGYRYTIYPLFPDVSFDEWYK